MGLAMVALESSIASPGFCTCGDNPHWWKHNADAVYSVSRAINALHISLD
jgi:hypothetical protein